MLPPFLKEPSKVRPLSASVCLPLQTLGIDPVSLIIAMKVADYVGSSKEMAIVANGFVHFGRGYRSL